MKVILAIGLMMGAAACGSGRNVDDRGLEQWVPMLEAALQDESPLVRCKAASGLEKIGAKAQEAVPALKCASLDPDPNVRCSAVAALDRIQSGGRPCRAR
jgi:HEAT repeat protein